MSYSNPMHHADDAHAPARPVDLLPLTPATAGLLRQRETLQRQVSDLRAALQALLALDVKGHQLQDRLQFSDAGRALLTQCRAALDE